MIEIQKILEKLSNAHGLSGYEVEVRKIVEEQVRPYVDEIKTDKMGNLIATKNGGSPIVMAAAHLDEIGLMTKYIDEKGFVHFAKIGGWFDETLLNMRMILHTENGKLYGVIGSKPPHLMKEEDIKKPVKAEEMFIDVGATSKEDAEKIGVKIGTPITPDTEFKQLGNDRVTGKAFDNRAGCTMLIGALQQMKDTNASNAKKPCKATVHAVFTVQEEVGLKGAKTSAFGLNPDVAIATDVTIAGDHPGIEKKQSSIEMGKGPSITISDNEGKGLIVNQSVLKWLKEAAESNNIPHQFDVGIGGTTDGSAIQLTREGIPTGVVSPPARYIHSPVSVLSMADLENCAKLIARAVEIVDKFF
jgi:putative aminopeptidase FrvX